MPFGKSVDDVTFRLSLRQLFLPRLKKTMEHNQSTHVINGVKENKLMSISVCSLKREVKVKVTKFCIGREELINVNKLTKFDLCIINGL